MASTGPEDTWRSDQSLQSTETETQPVSNAMQSISLDTSESSLTPKENLERNHLPSMESVTNNFSSSLPTSSVTTSSSTNSSNQDLITVPVISLRMLMGSKDVGSIIGKAVMTIKAFREQSGAKINISNGTSSERLVTVTGTKDSICTAFLAIGSKIQQDTASSKPGTDLKGVAASFRLIVQTSQCGSLIGKGGSKIKDIRESTGASIQVAGETLPNSTERAVTISGLPEAITLCIEEICNIILESPPKGPFVPYKPHTLPNQAYQPRPTLPYQTPYTATFNTAAQPTTTTQHMRIPNDLIGCVIGRKGSKIHEIRVSSGAMIKIAGNEGDGTDRLVTITGTPESVGMAQYLINSRIHSEVNSFLSIGLSTV